MTGQKAVADWAAALQNALAALDQREKQHARAALLNGQSQYQQLQMQNHEIASTKGELLAAKSLREELTTALQETRGKMSEVSAAVNALQNALAALPVDFVQRWQKVEKAINEGAAIESADLDGVKREVKTIQAEYGPAIKALAGLPGNFVAQFQGMLGVVAQLQNNAARTSAEAATSGDVRVEVKNALLEQEKKFEARLLRHSQEWESHLQAVMQVRMAEVEARVRAETSRRIHEEASALILAHQGGGRGRGEGTPAAHTR